MSAADGRKRSDYASSSLSVSTKGRGERLLVCDRPSGTVVCAFVNGTSSISRTLVRTVTNKWCEIEVSFTDVNGYIIKYVGQAGLLKGARQTASPDILSPAPKHSRTNGRSVMFNQIMYSSFKTTPVTAKHNLQSEDGEFYDRTQLISTTVQRDATVSTTVEISGAGSCVDVELTIQVCPGTEDYGEVVWMEDDKAFGKEIVRGSFTLKPKLFERVGPDFHLRVGHAVAIVVNRSFDIANADAGVPPSFRVNLVDIYGPKGNPCIYTGSVTEVSTNDKTFCHDINTFAGCSGAVVFLLDRQPDRFGYDDDQIMELMGKAVGVHVGGLDTDNNIGFLLGQEGLINQEEAGNQEEKEWSYRLALKIKERKDGAGKPRRRISRRNQYIKLDSHREKDHAAN